MSINACRPARISSANTHAGSAPFADIELNDQGRMVRVIASILLSSHWLGNSFITARWPTHIQSERHA